MHYAILDLVKAGQPLVTKKVFSTVTAKIGPERICPQYVEDLEAAGLIRCREVHNKGLQHGKFCFFEPT